MIRLVENSILLFFLASNVAYTIFLNGRTRWNLANHDRIRDDGRDFLRKKRKTKLVYRVRGLSKWSEMKDSRQNDARQLITVLNGMGLKLVRENVFKLLNVNRYAIPWSYLGRKQRGSDYESQLKW